ncbi:hypothetical protein RQP46_009697 [Phenoliferia psychrophenolica]
MWSRTYCCCAVPLYNSGIYAILVQFLVVSLVSGALSFAAPKIVSVAIPSWGPYLFGIVCIVVALAQVVGFFGVYREKPKLFKLYASINAILVSAALLIAVAFIGLSAGRHSTAVSACQDTFSSQGTVKSGSEICSIWTWVQIGIMGLLFVIIALCEAYFLMYQSIYASEQKLDHARYDVVVSTAAEEIRQSGLWDGQSDDFAPPGGMYSAGGGHQRTESKASGLRNELRREEPSQEHLSERAYADPAGVYHNNGGDPYAQHANGGAGGYQEEDPYAAYGSSSAYAQPQAHEQWEQDHQMQYAQQQHQEQPPHGYYEDDSKAAYGQHPLDHQQREQGGYR